MLRVERPRERGRLVERALRALELALQRGLPITLFQRRRRRVGRGRRLRGRLPRPEAPREDEVDVAHARVARLPHFRGRGLGLEVRRVLVADGHDDVAGLQARGRRVAPRLGDDQGAVEDAEAHAHGGRLQRDAAPPRGARAALRRRQVAGRRRRRPRRGALQQFARLRVLGGEELLERRAERLRVVQASLQARDLFRRVRGSPRLERVGARRRGVAVRGELCHITLVARRRLRRRVSVRLERVLGVLHSNRHRGRGLDGALRLAHVLEALAGDGRVARDGRRVLLAERAKGRGRRGVAVSPRGRRGVAGPARVRRGGVAAPRELGGVLGLARRPLLPPGLLARVAVEAPRALEQPLRDLRRQTLVDEAAALVHVAPAAAEAPLLLHERLGAEPRRRARRRRLLARRRQRHAVGLGAGRLRFHRRRPPLLRRLLRLRRRREAAQVRVPQAPRAALRHGASRGRRRCHKQPA